MCACVCACLTPSPRRRHTQTHADTRRHTQTHADTHTHTLSLPFSKLVQRTPVCEAAADVECGCFSRLSVKARRQRRGRSSMGQANVSIVSLCISKSSNVLQCRGCGMAGDRQCDRCTHRGFSVRGDMLINTSSQRVLAAWNVPANRGRERGRERERVCVCVYGCVKSTKKVVSPEPVCSQQANAPSTT